MRDGEKNILYDHLVAKAISHSKGNNYSEQKRVLITIRNWHFYFNSMKHFNYLNALFCLIFLPSLTLTILWIKCSHKSHERCHTEKA